MRRWISRPVLPILVAGWGWLAAAGSAVAAGPADPLYALLPGDVDVAIAVENLANRAREARGSAVVGGLRRLPGVADWAGSEPVRGVRRVVGQVEESIGAEPGAIRDRIFGDAFLLVLRGDPSGLNDQSRGMLLGKARDRDLLRKLIDAVNRGQTDGGELDRVEPRGGGASAYHRRVYRQEGRPDEFYAAFDDGVFAWSNAEDLLRAVVDRKARGGPSLADDADFRAVRAGLPSSSLLSLYVSTRAVAGSVAAGVGPSPSPLAGPLRAIRAAGAAVEFRDGVAFSIHQTVDPGRLDARLRDGLARLGRPISGAPLPRPSALAAVRLDVDFAAARDVVVGLMPADQRDKLEMAGVALQGLLLGRTLDGDILPRLGPGVLVSAGEPIDVEGTMRIPVAVEVAVKPGPDDPGPGAAIENALRTGLALYLLDGSKRPPAMRIDTRKVAGVPVLVLAGPRRSVLAYAATADRLALGNIPEAVVRPDAPGEVAPGPLEAIRREVAPDAAAVAVVDLGRLSKMIDARRGALAERLAGRRGQRGAEAISRDLESVAAAARLFRAGAVSLAAGRDGRAIHAEARLIAR